MDDFAKNLIAATHKEGIGSVYERFRLQELFAVLAEKYKIETVFEYDDCYTRGYENKAFLDRGKAVTVFSRRGLGRWPWSGKSPSFVREEPDGKFDLVWNFALLPRENNFLDRLARFSGKYILFFCPNYLNWGTPFHEAYHLLSQTECRHAERGSIIDRIAPLLALRLKRRKFKILKRGYVDAPWWPDTGASLAEVKKNILGMKPKKKDSRGKTKVDFNRIYQKAQPSVFESSSWSVFKPVLAHHFYFLLE